MIYLSLSVRFKNVIILSVIFLICNVKALAQSTNDFKNSIKFNVTNMLLYDNSYQLSYERIIKENQSINVFFGYQEFPLITTDLGENNLD